MISNGNMSKLQTAYTGLLNAQAELNRPHEDVVTLSACQAMRSSMRMMMEAYLSIHDAPASDEASISELAEMCSRRNSAFAKVAMSNLDCRDAQHCDCDGKYCLSVTHVSGCLVAAHQVKEIVWKELM